MALATSPKHEIAWAAGLFEGEGCLTISGPRAKAILKTTDRDVVARFAGVVGLGGLEPSPRMPRAGGLAKKPSWTWQATGHQNVQALIAAFWNFLGERRRARAREILLALAKTPRASKYRTPEYNGGKFSCGHPAADDNTYTNPTSGRRFCRPCLKAAQRSYHQKKREARLNGDHVHDAP